MTEKDSDDIVISLSQEECDDFSMSKNLKYIHYKMKKISEPYDSWCQGLTSIHDNPEN